MALDSSSGVSSELARHLSIVGVIYLATYAGLRLLDRLLDLSGGPEGLRPTIWGFHFILALGCAALFRVVVTRRELLRPPDPDTLSSFTGVLVEFTTCAALTAISGAVFLRYAGPIVLLTGGAAVVSLLACVALRRWVFVGSPFEYAISLFGAATGTVLTGMALLRGVDPQLRGDAARNQVVAAAGAIPFLAPVMVGLMPYLVAIHTPGSVRAAWVGLGLFGAYFVILVGLLWINRRRFT